jgi:hypothetical protein
LAGLLLAAPAASLAHQPEFTDSFSTDRCRFSSTGRNPYFILEPGYRLILEGEEDGDPVVLTITVLDATREVAGVETRVVEELEVVDGDTVEISRNFFAICAPTNSVFYFGEEVDIYEDGRLVGHEGAWRAGENGARAGVMMPGVNLIGARYYQEIAPGVAMDRAETASLADTLTTPAGRFEGVLRVEETTPLEPKAHEFKRYAPGVGLIQDQGLLLISVISP